jgi:hypothetical protein
MEKPDTQALKWGGFHFTQASIAVLLGFFSVVIYMSTIGHGYNMDDALVTKGHRLTSKGFMAMVKVFSSPYYEDDMGYSYEYRPITHLTFAIEHGLFGEQVGVSHFINVLLHSATVVLVFVVTRMMFPMGSLLFPLLAAALFAVHPMHTEVVASIKNRDELLALLFGVMALFFTVRAVSRGNAVDWPLIPLLLTLSLFSKSSGAAFLFLIPTCAFLRQDIRSRNLMLLLVCVTIPLGLHAFSRDMPFSRFTDVGLILTAPFLLFLLWRLVRSVDFARIFRAIRPKGWPDNRIGGHIVIVGEMSRSDIITVVLTMLFAVISLILQKPYLLILPLGLLLSGPYWIGRHNLIHILLFCSILTLLPMHRVFFAAGHLLKLYVLILCIANGYKFNRTWIIIIVMSLFPGLVSEFKSISGQLTLTTGVKTIMGYAFELIPFAITFALRGRIPKILTVVWALLCLVLLVDFLIHLTTESVFILIGSLVFLLHLRSLWPRWLPSSLQVIAVLIFVSAAVEVVSPLFNVPSMEVTVASEKEGTTIGSVEGGDDATADLDNRPLDFTEYPLGIEASLNERIGTASLILGHYLQKMFIPWPQAFYYGYDEVPLGNMKNPMALFLAVVHLLLFVLSVWQMRVHPVLSFGIIAYLSSIFLFSNFLATIPGMIGDRLTYVASFGFCMSFGYVITLAYQRLSTVMAKRVFMVAIGALLVIWSSMTVSRAAKWKDPLTLMRHDISTVPNSAQAHNLLASNLMQASYDAQVKENPVDMRHEAIHHFRESLRIWPNTLNVWYDLGRAYMTVNEPARALPCFRSAYGFDSTFTDAAWSAALIAEQLGRDSIAIQYYHHCIRFSTELEEAYSRLSYLYFTKEEFERSIEVNRMAIAHEPRWPAPYENAAQVFEAMEMPDSVAFYIGKRNKMLGMP